jgi:enediyne biosynthesis protein E4
MGIALGDYNRDGKLDLFVTTFSDDNKTLYRNDGDAAFTDVSFRAGLGLPTIPFLSWGTGFLDFDNDGLLDLFVANGHVYPIADQTDWGTTYAQRPLLFRNIDGNKFQEVPAAPGSGLASIVCARGAAFGDLFNDGHIDVVLNNIDSPPTLLRNITKSANHWLELKLLASDAASSSGSGPVAVAHLAERSSSGKPEKPIYRSPRDALGAKVFLTIKGIRERADVFSGGSYASSSDPRIHFGLGSATKIDKLEILWPDGKTEQIPPPAVDQIVTIIEDAPTVR